MEGEARIDGQEKEVHKVNYLLQSVIIPAGVHTLKLTYWPNSFYFGLYLSVFGLVSLLLTTVTLWKKFQS